MDELKGLMIWGAFGVFVGCGSYIGALAKENGPVTSVRTTWAAGLVYGLFFGLLSLGPLFLTGYFLALSIASFVAFLFTRLAPRLGKHFAAFLAGPNSGLTAFGVIWMWLTIWPFPH